jgi:hypothetical protein
MIYTAVSVNNLRNNIQNIIQNNQERRGIINRLDIALADIQAKLEKIEGRISILRPR